VLVALGLVIAACQAAPSASPSAKPSLAPFLDTSYPEGGPADCAYAGEIAQIKAVDPLTVEFALCYPDPAFLAKIALANNAIQDSAWLTELGPNGRLRVKANGTGPYMVMSGDTAAGDRITLARYDGYWGDPAIAAEVVFEWRSSAAARLRALRSGTVDGIDDPRPDDLAGIEGDSTLQLQPSEALNTTYIGMTNTFAPFDSVRIRHALALGIDRQRIIDNVFPPGSSLAEFFTPCSIEFGCVGNPWYDHDQDAAGALLANPGFPGPLTTHIYYRDEVDCGLPDPGLVAAELQTQLREELDITADLRLQESQTFMDNLSAGLLDGLYVLEWCGGYPDVTSFLDRNFNDPGNQQYGIIDASITRSLTAGNRTADPAARAAAYAAGNSAIRDIVPMIPIAHGGSGTAWKADVVGAVASPLHGESFAAVDPGERPRLVWMQKAPPRSFYCADETDGNSVRLCHNVFEQLYAFKPGTAVVTPGLAESCDPNEELTVWTCHLRSSVTFHDGAQLDANDVLLSYAVQWDSEHPLHIGRTGGFVSWAGEFGPFLNAPPPAP
jgi:peptide/nickel transport system substrate-binding protein